LLPQITVTANTNRNRRHYITEGQFGSTTRESFDSDGDQFSLTQPLWRPAYRATWHQAQESERQAEYQLEDAQQQLYLKLATVWFELMETRDQVEFTSAQSDALLARWNVARRAAELELGSPPEADEAHAKYEEAYADQASAELEMASKLAELERWVGPADGLVQPKWREGTTMPDLVGSDMDEWLEQIDAHNPTVRAAVRAVAAAEEEINKQRAGHQPTLDMVASYGDTTQDVGSTPSQSAYQNRQWAVGLQLSVPLYSGGTQSAKVVEARALRDKANEELAAARRQAQTDVKTAFLTWRAGQAKSGATRASLVAARSALAAAERGESHGLKVPADVLEARQQLAAVYRNMRKAVYQQIMAYIKLRAAVGQLSAGDIDDIDMLFEMPAGDNPVAASVTMQANHP